MKKNRKLAKVASRLWPVGHRRYEEMCVLAVTGQLGGPQMCELNDHIATCDSCREYLESVAQMSVQAMPLLAKKHAPAADVVPPAGIRARFLSRLAAGDPNTNGGSTTRPHVGGVQRPFSVSSGEEHEVENPIGADEESTRLRFSTFPLQWRSVAALAACAVIGIGGFYLGEWRAKQTAQQATETESRRASVSQENAPMGASDRVSQLQRQKSELEREVSQLKQKVLNAQAERASLSDELAAAKDRLATFTMQAQGVAQHSWEENQEAKHQVVTLQSEVERLNKRLAESEVKLGVQKQMAEELTAKLEAATADLQRQRDLKSAKSELGDLAAARNLHIVDVYDADPNGKRQRPFGRVFYIEGRSLVFYAYDLDAPGRFKSNVVFHLWGGKAGVKEVTHSLGILHKDDAAQDRWALTFDDPKVLAQINSVFVTAEPANKHYQEPHGKKVLYAYFGSPPNHP